MESLPPLRGVQRPPSFSGKKYSGLGAGMGAWGWVCLPEAPYTDVALKCLRCRWPAGEKGLSLSQTLNVISPAGLATVWSCRHQPPSIGMTNAVKPETVISVSLVRALSWLPFCGPCPLR